MLGDPLYTPTPAEIAAECAKIRAEWSPEIEQLRTFPGYRKASPSIPGEVRGSVVCTDRPSE